MGKKKKTAPEYYETKYETGDLFGSAVNSKGGTSFTANEGMNTAGQQAWGGLNAALQNINSNDYSNDANFQVYQDNFNRNAQQAYDTNVLGSLTDRGLMRSSGLQAATNSFNNTLNQNLANLYDNYYNRQQNTLNANQNTLNNLYNYITGINTAASNQGKALNDYNMQRVLYNNANAGNGALAGGLSGAMSGAAAGSSFGPWGALAGALIGGASGAMNG